LCVSGAQRDFALPPPEVLEDRIERIREAGRGHRYDCVVGVSGGRDSSYLLYQLVRRHGLRCVAGYHRTPYTPDVIDANVRRMVERLGVRLVEMDISKEHHIKWARRALLLWHKQPTATHASLACAPCKQHNREILKIARVHGVRFLVMGSNRYEAVQVASASSGKGPGRELTLVSRLGTLGLVFRKGTVALSKSRDLWRFLPVGVKSVLFLSPDAPFLRLMYPEVETLNYFYYAGWDEEECEAALRDVGWELPDNCNTTWRADCAFGEIKDRMFAITSGMSYSEAFYANRVREGDLTREEALQRMATEGQPSDARLAEACATLDLPVEMFTQPPATVPQTASSPD
jgi:hypothetical protein